MVSQAANEARFTFKIDGQEDNWEVVRFKGSEAVGQLFTFTAEVVHPEHQADLAGLVGKRATLRISSGMGWRYVDGLIRRVDEAGRLYDYNLYVVSIVPSVWVLTLTQDSRIFQEMTTQDIIEKVFQDAGVRRFRFALSGTYSPRNYCVQYRESDWNFVSRLMEEEGMFYHFEYGDDGDTLVIGDSPNVHQSIKGDATVVFRLPGEGVPDLDYVYQFQYSQQIRTGKSTLKDFNFETPSLPLLKDNAAQKYAELEVYDYPGLHADDARGGTLAKIRTEMQQARREFGVGRSQCTRMTTGCKFTLSEHALTDRNTEYLILSVEHEGVQPLEEFDSEGFEYNNRFECILATVPFRPARVARKPFVQGSQTAIVTGPAGEEIYTDQYGRVKVQFHWDREGQQDEKTSCWIRVAQLWAGNGWGAMFIPRIGHEVIVDFLEGDPDRPIITGRVYHAENMPPYTLDSEKTKSTIKSNSTKGGEGFNEYRFEDLKGSEEIYQHAQKDLTIKTENDKNQETVHNETLKIGNDRTKTVDHDEKTYVKNNRTETVDKDETITIKGKRTETVHGDETITIKSNRSETVEKDETIAIQGKRTETVDKDETISVKKNRTVSITEEETLTVGKARSTEVGDDDQLKVGKKYALEAADEILLKTGSASILMKKDGTIQIKGKDITISGSGKINVKASSNLVLKGSQIAAN